MLELLRVRSDVIGCYAAPSALDRMAPNTGLAIRIAPNEMLCLGDGDRFAALSAELVALDGDALVVDLASAFAIWALSGGDRFEAFCRLSALELPRATSFLQGLVARVPAKVVVLERELLVIVSSVLSHHLRDRVLDACADLAPVEREDAALPEPLKHGALA